MLFEVSSLLYIIAAIFAGCFIVLIAISVFRRRLWKPVFGWALAVPAIAAVGYYLAGSGIGYISPLGEPINAVRYIDWMISTPILMYLLAYAMIPDSQERNYVSAIWVLLMMLVIVTGFVATVTVGAVKAIAFMVSSLLYTVILYQITDRLLQLDSISMAGQQQSYALRMAWVILILWTVYPFVWIFGPSGIEVLSNLVTGVLFGVLDITTKVGFVYLLLRYLQVQLLERKETDI